jgi:Holliday junction resolvase
MASTKGASARGRSREREVKKQLEAEGFFVIKAGGSLGEADLVALKAGQRGLMLEVKSTTAGPYHSFGPEKREALYDAAAKAGLEPYLVFWPPRKEMEFINWKQWPSS